MRYRANKKVSRQRRRDLPQKQYMYVPLWWGTQKTDPQKIAVNIDWNTVILPHIGKIQTERQTL